MREEERAKDEAGDEESFTDRLLSDTCTAAAESGWNNVSSLLRNLLVLELRGRRVTS